MIARIEQTRPTHFLACNTCPAASDHLRDANSTLQDEGRQVSTLGVICDDIHRKIDAYPGTANMTIRAVYSDAGEEGRSETLTVNGKTSDIVSCKGALE